MIEKFTLADVSRWFQEREVTNPCFRYNDKGEAVISFMMESEPNPHLMYKGETFEEAFCKVFLDFPCKRVAAENAKDEKNGIITQSIIELNSLVFGIDGFKRLLADRSDDDEFNLVLKMIFEKLNLDIKSVVDGLFKAY